MNRPWVRPVPVRPPLQAQAQGVHRAHENVLEKKPHPRRDPEWLAAVAFFETLRT